MMMGDVYFMTDSQPLMHRVASSDNGMKTINSPPILWPMLQRWHYMQMVGFVGDSTVDPAHETLFRTIGTNLGIRTR